MAKPSDVKKAIKTGKQVVARIKGEPPKQMELHLSCMRLCVLRNVSSETCDDKAFVQQGADLMAEFLAYYDKDDEPTEPVIDAGDINDRR